MTTQTGQEIRLASRPHGWPTAENFEMVKVDVAEPGPGQVLVRNTYMSVDPYMRGRMNDVPSYVPPFKVGNALDGGAIGEVIASNSDRVRVGATVLHGYGWRDLVVLDDKRVSVVDVNAVPSPAVYLGALGTTGLTAYVGLFDIAAFKPGDTVFVSGAAGAVGSVVGQLAKMRGAARVIGSAGSAEKVARCTEQYGFDAAVNYKDGRVRDLLREAAPDGIDVYFDNVGGDHLAAAIYSMRNFGRIAVCGAIDQYNATSAVPGPTNMAMIIGKRLTLRGFIVTDHLDRMADFVAEAGAALRDGKLTCDETIVDGLANAPDAFLGLLRGENISKMVVKLV
jgi:NADPH-dependent curcumin reductase CurA